MSSPTGWRPYPPPPQRASPPTESNGWGRYVAGAIEHMLVRMHYLEQGLEELKDAVREPPPSASDAPISSPPLNRLKDWQAMIKEVGVVTRWIAVIVLSVLLGFKLIDLPTIGKLVGTGG